jgi:hypothetical protein
MLSNLLRGERYCVICHGRLADGARVDTRTCSARCRQRLTRLRHEKDRQDRIEVARSAGTRLKRMRRGGAQGPKAAGLMDQLQAKAHLSGDDAVVSYHSMFKFLVLDFAKHRHLNGLT